MDEMAGRIGLAPVTPAGVQHPHPELYLEEGEQPTRLFHRLSEGM